MTSFISMFVWVVMAAVLVGGIVMATVSGSFWLLGLGVLMFVAACTKWGILPHN